MTAIEFCQLLGDLDDHFLAETLIEPKRWRHKLSIALLAAILSALLMGAGLVTALYGDSILSYFQHYWKAANHRPMDECHMKLLEKISQDISLEQTVNGVTVTADSAAVGDDCFFLLLRVSGTECSKDEGYNFGQVHMEVEPDPRGLGEAMLGYSYQFEGLDADGSALFMMIYHFALSTEFEATAEPFQVTLQLTDFYQNSNGRVLLTEGTWSFEFALDRSHKVDTLAIADVDLGNSVLTNIVLTNTGIRFCEDSENPFHPRVQAILSTGARVHIAGGYGQPTEDGSGTNFSFPWRVPIDLEQVVALQLNDIVIPLHN